MASKKTREALKSALESMPVHPLTITFTSTIAKKYADVDMVNDVKISDLPKEVKHSITVERLEGFQYSNEFTQMMEGFKHANLYAPAGVTVISRGRNVVKTSLLALTTAKGLYNFMLNNAVKLYIQPSEMNKKLHIYDRNFSEICGMDFRPDDVTKAYVSSVAIRLTKEDIKDTANMMTIIQTEDYENFSPVRSLNEAVKKLMGPERLLNYEKAKEAQKKAKLIGYRK